MSNFIINRNHPLIEREQTYFLDRKLVSIHSVDRDINKWINSNNFEVELPENLMNVYSLRLISINLPNNLYTFTNNYRNTKFIFSIQSDASGNTDDIQILEGYELSGGLYTVEISEGFYTPEELQNELQGKINETVNNTLYDFSSNYTQSYDYFKVKYDKPTNKYYIVNTRDNFTLLFDEQPTYTNVECGFKDVWEQYYNWGLPYNLGYNKERYTSSQTNAGDDLAFFYDGTTFQPSSDNSSNSVKYAVSNISADILVNECIYLELDKYNSMDEIVPYSQNTNATYNNDYSGKINGAFAKIPLLNNPHTQVYDSRNGFLNNITFFKVPIPTIRKLKFKFRFHDGNLVDFKNMPLSFVIEANQLIDEQQRYFTVNAPFIYST